LAPQPRIRIGTVVLAGIFLSVFGALWYGVLFKDLQQLAHRYTPEEYARSSPAWYVGGAVLSLCIASGLALMVRLGASVGAAAGFKAGSRAALGFGIPLVAYPFVYSPLHELGLFAAGAAHILIGWTVAGALIAARSRPAQAGDSSAVSMSG
jgi:hypothetical protein